MEILETVTSLLADIKENGFLVIVEGKKDRDALRQFGIKNIITLSKKPLFQIVEELPASEVVILTDFDRTGRTLYAILSRECNWRGIHVNNKLRLFLLQNTPVTHIEGIPSYLAKIENAPPGTFNTH